MTPPDLSALADAVEQAWGKGRPFDIMDEVHGVYRLTEEDACKMLASVGEWLTARRAARAAGYREAMVSRETVEALRAAQGNGDTVRACNLLARDLAPLLKETP
jgi:hypothetical protein